MVWPRLLDILKSTKAPVDVTGPSADKPMIEMPRIPWVLALLSPATFGESPSFQPIPFGNRDEIHAI